MNDKKLLNKTILEISDLLDKKEVTSTDLTNLVFKEIELKDPEYKAFITLCKEEALKAAKEADKRISEGKRLSKIDGVPINLKDNIMTSGVKTTASSKMLGDFTPNFDATVWEKLKNAGAVLIGKTNLDAWAHGSSTENSDFFTTKNPFDRDRVPGGSSGGSACAVALDLGYASLGTDTGGSIRQPASFCGVVGLKPTYGRVSRYGLVAMASSLDQAGPITKSAKDAALILQIIAGEDTKDSTTVAQDGGDFMPNDNFDFKGKKIGLPKEYFTEGLDPKIKKTIMEQVEKFEKAGAQIVEVSLPNTDYALAVYYIIQPAEVSSNLARYDGIRYGYQSKQANDINELYLQSRKDGFGDEAKRRIMLGTYVLSSGYYDAYYKKALEVKSLVKKDFEDVFKKVDVLITPTCPTLPFKIGQNVSDPLAMYLADVYTVSANIAGIPAVSVNAGMVDGLPVGLQIMGPDWSEKEILNFANFVKEE